MSKIKLVGMTFSKREFPSLKETNPQGTVEFVRNTKFDKPELPDCKGIMVMAGDIHIGWVANQSPEQVAINALIDAGLKPEGFITECDYQSPKPWCEVDVDIDAKEDSEPADDKNFKFYEKDGERYERASTIMESFDASGLKGVEGSITRWMCDTFGSYNEYREFMTDAADNGTALHLATEVACRSGVLDAETTEEVVAAIKGLSDDQFNSVPIGFWNFIAKECAGLKIVELEDQVFDKDIFVAGTYDALFEGNGKRIIADWKSAKQINLEHVIKTCFYAKMMDADEAWVIAFGSKNKSGYQLKKVGRVSIENGYQVLKQAAKAFYFVKDLKDSIKAGV